MTPIHHYNASTPGIRLAVTGAIHGNEICGTHAIHHLMDDLDNGRITLQQGALTLIPICNPEAYRLQTRFIEENLNRVFRPHDHAQTYERQLANFLTPVLESCDALLDLHSIHTKGMEFAMCFNDTPANEMDFITAMNMPAIIHGWSEAYARSFPQQDKGQDMHTAGFMRSKGKIAAGIECGQHDDPQSADIAYYSILRALHHFQMIDIDLPPAQQPQHIMLDTVHIRRHEQDRFARDFMHGDTVRKGDILAITHQGDMITAPDDMLILFPRPACPVSEEWFYSGHKIAV